MGRATCGCLLALLVFAATATAAQDPTQTCLECHGHAGFGIRYTDGSFRSLELNPEQIPQSVHRDLSCFDCHRDMGRSTRLAELPELPAGVAKYVDALPGPAGVVLRSCVSCHPQEAAEYEVSRHAQAVTQGVQEAPVCYDCHGHHNIVRADDIESRVNPDHVAATCASCHADALLMARFDVNTQVVETYDTSFHGEKRSLGEERAAVCTSCHEQHAIRAPEDPQSSVNPLNAPQTCGRCHEGATPAFAAAFQHRAATARQSPIVYWIGRFYQLMITLTIGGMVLWMLLDFRRRRQSSHGGEH